MATFTEDTLRSLDAVCRLSVLALLAVAPLAHAGDKAGCHDPEWAPQRLPGFELTSCETRDWASIDVYVTDGERIVDGRRTVYEYKLRDESKDPAAKVARDRYRAAGERAGGKLVSAEDDGWKAVLEKSTPQGKLWYVYEHGSGNESSTTSYTVTTLE